MTQVEFEEEKFDHQTYKEGLSEFKKIGLIQNAEQANKILLIFILLTIILTSILYIKSRHTYQQTTEKDEFYLPAET